MGSGRFAVLPFEEPFVLEFLSLPSISVTFLFPSHLSYPALLCSDSIKINHYILTIIAMFFLSCKKYEVIVLSSNDDVQMMMPSLQTALLSVEKRALLYLLRIEHSLLHSGSS